MALFRKALVLGGGAAVAAVAFLKRDKVTGLLPSRPGAPEPAAPPPPAPSNYDAPGPVANTATPVPAPEPQVRPAGLDEAAEEAAAAAEAANIGGGPTHYAGPAGEPASAAELPLAEAGGGESEGLEQAEAELVENTVVRDAGTSDAEHQLDEAMERQSSPLAGETVEPLVSGEPSGDAPATEGKAPAEIVPEGPLSVGTPAVAQDDEHHDDEDAEAVATPDGPQPRAYSAPHPPAAPGASDDGEEHEPSTFHERGDAGEPRTYSGSEPPEYVEHPESDEEHEPHDDADVATHLPPSPPTYDAPPTEPVPAGAAVAAPAAVEGADQLAPPASEPAVELAAAGDEPAGIAPGQAVLDAEQAAAATPDQDATGAEPEDRWETWTGPKVPPPPKE